MFVGFLEQFSSSELLSMFVCIISVVTSVCNCSYSRVLKDNESSVDVAMGFVLCMSNCVIFGVSYVQSAVTQSQSKQSLHRSIPVRNGSDILAVRGESVFDFSALYDEIVFCAFTADSCNIVCCASAS